MRAVLHSILDSIREDGRGGVSAPVYSLRDGAIGGVAGGTAMVIVAMLYGMVSGNGIWFPVNLIAATAIRQWQSAPPELFTRFDPAGLIFGAGIHVIVSIAIALLFTLLLPALPGHPLIWAFVVGPMLWFGALFGVLPLINPVMAHNVDPASFLASHLFYSLVVGFWLERARPLKSW